jgi:hypothetical protein
MISRGPARSADLLDWTAGSRSGAVVAPAHLNQWAHAAHLKHASYSYLPVTGLVAR